MYNGLQCISVNEILLLEINMIMINCPLFGEEHRRKDILSQIVESICREQGLQNKILKKLENSITE